MQEKCLFFLLGAIQIICDTLGGRFFFLQKCHMTIFIGNFTKKVNKSVTRGGGGGLKSAEKVSHII
jgi:hypothetical protein